MDDKEPDAMYFKITLPSAMENAESSKFQYPYQISKSPPGLFETVREQRKAGNKKNQVAKKVRTGSIQERCPYGKISYPLKNNNIARRQVNTDERQVSTTTRRWQTPRRRNSLPTSSFDHFLQGTSRCISQR
jgi:hypothetical protein